jgi:hypothetical protein
MDLSLISLKWSSAIVQSSASFALFKSFLYFFADRWF